MHVRSVIIMLLVAFVLGYATGVARIQRKWDNAKQAQIKIDSAESMRRSEETLEVLNNAVAEYEAAEARANDLDRNVERLQQLLAQQRSRFAKTVSSCEAVQRAFDVQADVLGRSIAANSILAKYADTTRIAGDTCQQQYRIISGESK